MWLKDLKEVDRIQYEPEETDRAKSCWVLLGN